MPVKWADNPTLQSLSKIWIPACKWIATLQQNATWNCNINSSGIWNSVWGWETSKPIVFIDGSFWLMGQLAKTWTQKFRLVIYHGFLTETGRSSWLGRATLMDQETPPPTAKPLQVHPDAPQCGSTSSNHARLWETAWPPKCNWRTRILLLRNSWLLHCTVGESFIARIQSLCSKKITVRIRSLDPKSYSYRMASQCSQCKFSHWQP